MKRQWTKWLVPGSAAAALAGMLGLTGNLARTQEKKDAEISLRVQSKETDAGLMVSARATAKEVGLPVYPGAVPHKDEKGDSSAAKLGLWGNSFGFKLLVLKMESSDAPKKVAEFYGKALGKYGTVLDCTNPTAAGEEKGQKPDKLTCGDDKPEKGGMLFKAGSKTKQHIVGVQPNGAGTVFQLIYVETRGEEREPV